jgi:hypothetical protein
MTMLEDIHWRMAEKFSQESIFNIGDIYLAIQSLYEIGLASENVLGRVIRVATHTGRTPSAVAISWRAGLRR